MAKVEELLRDGGYLVDVTFHKVGTNITISPEVLGVEVRGNEELGDFFHQFVKDSQISWLGKRNKQIRRAESIAKSVHKRKIKDSLDGKHYMPKSKLPEYKEFLKGKKKEFYEVRDELVDSYEFDVRQFEAKLRNNFLSETITDSAERDKVVKAIMNKVPTKDELKESFKIEQSYMLFAMTSELVDEDDKEASIERANQRMNEINGRTLAVVFEKLNKIMRALMNKKHTKTHVDMADEIVEELNTRNLFNHSTIEDIKVLYGKVKDNQDLDDYELIIGKLYRFAQDIGEEHQLPTDECVLSLKQLDFLAKVA